MTVLLGQRLHPSHRICLSTRHLRLYWDRVAQTSRDMAAENQAGCGKCFKEYVEQRKRHSFL